MSGGLTQVWEVLSLPEQAALGFLPTHFVLFANAPPDWS